MSNKMSITLFCKAMSDILSKRENATVTYTATPKAQAQAAAEEKVTA